MYDADEIFIYIEMGLFAALGLLVPLGAIVFSAPGAFMSKAVSILFLGIPYAFTEYAPYFTWFWLSVVAIFVLHRIQESDNFTISGRIVAGIGVILAFLVIDSFLAILLLMIQTIDSSSGLGLLIHKVGSFTGIS